MWRREYGDFNAEQTRRYGLTGSRVRADVMNMDASNGWAFDERPFAAVGGYGRTRPLFGGEKALDRLIAGFDAAMFGQAVGEPEGSRAGEAGWRVPVIRQCETRDDAGMERGSAASAHQGRTALGQGNTPLTAMREAQSSTPGLEEPTPVLRAPGKADAGLRAATPAPERCEQMRPTLVIR